MHRGGMRKKNNICVSLVGYCFLALVVIPPAACSASSFFNTISTLDTSSTITQIPDVKPGDQVRYSLHVTLQYFSIVFAWGTVTCNCGSIEKLTLQFALFTPGEHSLYWDSTVPSSAYGPTAIEIVYLSIPGGIKRQASTFNVIGSPLSAAYVGSMQCMGCHAGFNKDIVDAYTQSGHHFALTAVSGQAPLYPAFAPGVPDPPQGASWSDISYVIGGYGWAANFASRDNGTLVTGSGAQYNPANSMLKTLAEFAAYESANTTPGKFTCGPCHATGYSPEGSQDNRSNIAGSWFEDGVGCEACHGPGIKHVYNPYSEKTPFDPTKICANCHERDSQAVVQAGAGLIRNKQQAQELNATGKSFMKCTTCHNAHASAHFDARASGSPIIKQCTVCHSSVTVGLGMQNLKCIDCHMPYAVQAGASTSFTDSSNNVYALGDMRSHIFKINADAAGPGKMFSDNGTQLVLDTSGKTAWLTLDFVCLGCHRTWGRAATSYTFEQVKNFA